MADTEHRLFDEHIYEGMRFAGDVTPATLDQIKDFHFCGDTIVASYPKTGTTWLQEMIWLIMNDGDAEAAGNKNIFKRCPYMDRAGLEMCAAMPRPAMYKTHLPQRFFSKQFETDQAKYLIPVRNPKDTAVSYYRFYQANALLGRFKGTWDEYFQMFVSDTLEYGNFFDWYAGWWSQRDREDVMFVKYEDMKKDLPAEVKKVASFLGKSLPDDKIEGIARLLDFESMKKNKTTNYSWLKAVDMNISPFMRSGSIGDWKKYFSKEQSDKIDEMYKSSLESIGLYLEFE